MKIETEYLSEEALAQLIAEVESGDMVLAPPDLQESILRQLHIQREEEEKEEPVEKSETVWDSQKQGKELNNKKRAKKKEFYRYCVQIGLGCAACVAMIFMIPFIPAQEYEMSIAQREEQRVPSREEVLASNRRISLTREEVLEGKSVWQKMLENLGLEKIKIHLQEESETEEMKIDIEETENGGAEE